MTLWRVVAGGCGGSFRTDQLTGDPKTLADTSKDILTLSIVTAVYIIHHRHDGLFPCEVYTQSPPLRLCTEVTPRLRTEL
jgi:hypothetical protein